jgi:hypothetical protein
VGGLAAAVRSGVTAWKAATSTAQGVVTFEAWIADSDAKGTHVYADPVPLRALIQRNPADREQPSGDERKILAIVTFLEALPAVGAAGRDEPIDTRDRITLPDGSSGPITEVKGGWIDAETGLPYMAQATLGKG